MKKLIAGICALSIVTGTTFIANAISSDDFRSIQKYFLGMEEEIDVDILDVNSDGKIDIIDYIKFNELLVNKSDVSISEVNGYAGEIYEIGTYAVKYLKNNEISILDGIYTDADDSQIVQLINENIKIPSEAHWTISVKNRILTEAMCEFENVAGVYPNTVPKSVKLDYNSVTEEELMNIYTNWKLAHPECVKSDSDKPDYTEKTTKDMNSSAMKIYSALDKYMSFDNSDYTGILKYEDMSDELLDCVYRLSGINPLEIQFSAVMEDGKITGCICYDSQYKTTGAYPNAIPNTMNISYDENIVIHSADILFDWKKEMPEYISEDADIPDFSEKSVAEYNSYAFEIFIECQNILQECETSGKQVDNGIYTEESELFKGLVSYREHFIISVDNYIVKCCIISDGDGSRSGAYPNAVPQSMNVKFGDSLIETASDYNLNWKNTYPEFISADEEQVALPDYPVKSVSYYNNLAKSAFSNAQTILQEYETYGKEFKNGLCTGDDLDIFTQGCQYYILVENYIVKAVIVGAENHTGAYPNTVPVDMNISFDKEIIEYAADSNSEWKEIFPDCISKDLIELSHIENINNPVWTINSLNSIAKTIFSNANTIAVEFETMGEIVNGIFSSDSTDRFVEAVKSNISENDCNWSVKVENNIVIGVCVSDKSKKFTGAYPNMIPDNFELIYDGYNEICEKSHNCDEWKEIGNKLYWYDIF